MHDFPLEPTPEYAEMVTVFEGDSSSAAVARAAVEGAGIKSWVRNEEAHGVLPCLGPAEVQVRAEDERSALNALETK